MILNSFSSLQELIEILSFAHLPTLTHSAFRMGAFQTKKNFVTLKFDEISYVACGIVKMPIMHKIITEANLLK